MKNVALSFTGLLVLIVSHPTSVRGEDFKLSPDMSDSTKKIDTQIKFQDRNPATVNTVNVYTVGFNSERPLFEKIGPQENNRVFRASHPVGLQAPLFGLNLQISVYLLPFSHVGTSPFADTSSKITNSNLERGGFAFAYGF